MDGSIVAVTPVPEVLLIWDTTAPSVEVELMLPTLTPLMVKVSDPVIPEARSARATLLKAPWGMTWLYLGGKGLRESSKLIPIAFKKLLVSPAPPIPIPGPANSKAPLALNDVVTPATAPEEPPVGVRVKAPPPKISLMVLVVTSALESVYCTPLTVTVPSVTP